mgnify:CR=1 FL=1
MRRYVLLSGVLLIGVALGWGAAVEPQVWLPFVSRAPPQAQVSGTVIDEERPVSGATVRIQATTNATTSDQHGRFTLSGLTTGVPVTVSAWKAGYYCSKMEGVHPPSDNVTMTLRAYQTGDNPDHEWMPPIGEESCASCKAEVTSVWLENDAHGGASSNPRFLTMYNGTDVYGNQSPLTRYRCSRDYGCVPVPPDPSQPYYGPGYVLDFPRTAGNCAACHTPGAALDEPLTTDPNLVSGADSFGIHCDFCHKVADVIVDPESGLPHLNMPGVLSMDVRRPFADDPERPELFFGTFDDDNVPEEDTYLPLIEESEYCAPCHYAEFWGVPIYNSFGEWLDSPYSDSATGLTCQECHMPAPTIYQGEPISNVAPGKGGVERDPATIHAHTFDGAASETLLQNAVTMTGTTSLQPGVLVVTVEITNDQTGHHVPTDSPLRHLILHVDARDARGHALSLLQGETLPEWCGVGDPTDGCYAGLPGKAFAKVLQELWTEVSPSGAYWNQTKILSDNRIAPFATDQSSYTFAAPAEGPVTVEVVLWFRRAFKDVIDWKQWDAPDIMMEHSLLEVQLE